MSIGFTEFDAVHQGIVDDLIPLLSPKMQASISRHNVGWSHGRTCFEVYLRRSSLRFYLAAVAALGSGADTACDVGGFWGVLPIALRRLGVRRVAMTEAMRYYGPAFDVLFELVASEGVEVIDYDPFEADSPLPSEFGFVSLMAVLEHYPHSPRHLMENVLGMLSAQGVLYMDVPNIAYLPRRLALLRGISPLPTITDILASEVPFVGHHHEYTVAELRDLADSFGLVVEDLWCFNYSSSPGLNTQHGARAFLQSIGEFTKGLIELAVPNARECIGVRCHRPGVSSGNPSPVGLTEAQLVGLAAPAHKHSSGGARS